MDGLSALRLQLELHCNHMHQCRTWYTLESCARCTRAHTCCTYCTATMRTVACSALGTAVQAGAHAHMVTSAASSTFGISSKSGFYSLVLIISTRRVNLGL